MNLKKGSLTIEASIALTTFMFIVLMVLSFSNLYQAQSLVSHATLQTSQSLAVESYYRETISKSGTADAFSKLLKFADFMGWDVNQELDDWYASLGESSTNFYKIVKKTFAYTIADNVDLADKILENAGIMGGIDGIDFSYSAVNGGDIIINARYKVKLPFAFFGERTIELSKSAKMKAFEKISDNNGYEEPEESEK